MTGQKNTSRQKQINTRSSSQQNVSSVDFLKKKNNSVKVQEAQKSYAQKSCDLLTEPLLNFGAWQRLGGRQVKER